MDDVLAGLNESQIKAVTTTEGYVRVVAGAGSGKQDARPRQTLCLPRQRDGHHAAGNILCVTFTNKASNEMRQRIHALTGDNDAGYVNTSTASAYRCFRRIRRQ